MEDMPDIKELMEDFEVTYMIDWTNAPEWAKWHTEDTYGRTWWAKRPRHDEIHYYDPANESYESIAHWWYDTTPCEEMKLTLRPLPPNVGD